MRALLILPLLLPAGATARTCIPVRNITATDTPDNHTIIFHMTDGRTYANLLPAPCPGLKQNVTGFTYGATPGTDEVCETETVIRINFSGAICQLGPFRPVAAPSAQGPSPSGPR